MAGRPHSAVPNIFASQGAGAVNNIPMLDADFSDILSFFNDSAIGWHNYGLDIGTANNYACTLTATPSAYITGMLLSLLVTNTNTGASVININALGNIGIISLSGAPLVAAQMTAGTVAVLCYNGTNFVLLAGTNANPAASSLIGEVKLFAGTSFPTNWLLCDGTSYSTTGPYAPLFTVISYNFGGSGANFNVPNMTNRVPYHGAPGATGGSNSVILAIGNLPAHNHTINVSESPHTHTASSSSTDSGHVHGYDYIAQAFTAGGVAANTVTSPGAANLVNTRSGTANITTSTTVNAASTGISATSANTGSGTAITTTPAYLQFNYIIRAL